MCPKTIQILAVDDDEEILRLIRRILQIEGFQVQTLESGDAVVQELEKQPFDLVLLDLMLPHLDGISVCRLIRNFSTIPIIMLTAKTSDQDQVEGLAAGADDYITKPFSTQALIARVKAVLRRSQMTFPPPPANRLVRGDLVIDFAERQVTVAGKEIKLTQTEFNLLQELTQHQGKVLTHSHLLNHVWGNEYQDELRYLHVFISRLRTKLGLQKSGTQVFENISGVGYRFNTP
jgi:DNA-binding response OmpR family regulator